jgi:hypothetical protein
LRHVPHHLGTGGHLKRGREIVVNKACK